MRQIFNRYLRTLSKTPTKGFTLLELIIVMVVMGILGAIALPSILNQSTRAREAQAQSMVGAVNRAQQAYRLDSAEFANSMAVLTVNVPSSTEMYTFAFGTTNSTLAEYEAQPTNGDLRAFTGCARADFSNSVTTTSAEILQSPAGGGSPATPPTC
uniref:General secretion pathway protein n=1 Tax=Cyanothece sp. (strain PCC 7425 / ATCC 29141) TaxID=395961 RepID=B8HX19_CYAP4